MAAAVWLGVGLVHGFACLFVFVFAFQATRLYQRRSNASSRREPARSRRRRPARERSRSEGRLYDSDRDELDWPVAGEGAW